MRYLPPKSDTPSTENQETRFPKHQPQKIGSAPNHLVGEYFRNRWFSPQIRGEWFGHSRNHPKSLQERPEDRYRSENLQSDLLRSEIWGMSTLTDNPVEKGGLLGESSQNASKSGIQVYYSILFLFYMKLYMSQWGSILYLIKLDTQDARKSENI